MTVDSGRRPKVGDILDDPDDPIVNVEPGWMSDNYGEPAVDAWLRHIKMAVGRSPLPKRLTVAEKTYPIIKAARDFLSAEGFASVVGALKPAYRKGLRVGVNNGSRQAEMRETPTAL